MPNWNEVLTEIQAAGSIHDVIRRRYLAHLHEVTGRNIIAYYSGWLQKSGIPGGFLSLTDRDKNAFMSTIYGLDRSKGLDLILHTPGGEIAATEALVTYLRSMFGKDIRAIVPQVALSAGTMIALSCKQIIMGKHSSLGPIDPQLNGMPAHGIVEEFERAKKEIDDDPSTIPVWQPILAKYRPTLIGEAEKAIEWSEEMVKEWLVTGMFSRKKNKADKADDVVTELGSHALTKSHSRHISIDRAKDLGLKVVALEDDDDLQDAVLTVHHAFIQTLSATEAFKMVENHDGIAHIQRARASRQS